MLAQKLPLEKRGELIFRHTTVVDNTGMLAINEMKNFSCKVKEWFKN